MWDQPVPNYFHKVTVNWADQAFVGVWLLMMDVLQSLNGHWPNNITLAYAPLIENNCSLHCSNTSPSDTICRWQCANKCRCGLQRKGYYAICAEKDHCRSGAQNCTVSILKLANIFHLKLTQFLSVAATALWSRMVVIPAALPEIIVLAIAWAMAVPSPGCEIEACDPPLKAKKPNIRIKPPRAASCNK